MHEQTMARTSNYVAEPKPSPFWTKGRSNSGSSYENYCAPPSTRTSYNPAPRNLLGHISGQCPVGPLTSGRFTSQR